MAAPKRVWTKKAVPIEKAIGYVLTNLDEEIMRQAILAVDASKKGPMDVKELVNARSALADVLKRKQGDKVARQSAIRERSRRRALEGDNALDREPQVP